MDEQYDNNESDETGSDFVELSSSIDIDILVSMILRQFFRSSW